jgi:hypothetical protein
MNAVAQQKETSMSRKPKPGRFTKLRIGELETKQARLITELADLAGIRSQLISKCDELRNEANAERVARETNARRADAFQARLRDLMDAAVSGDVQRLHAAVLREVRNYWTRDDR